MNPFQFASPSVTLAWAVSFLLALASSGQQLPLPQMETNEYAYSQLLLPDNGGFFPTEGEYPLLRGAADARSADGDRRTQGATGLFPYQDPVPNFYHRNPKVFRTLDQMLGVFLPQDVWTIERKELQHSALTFDANLGGGVPLVRNFSPDLAMIKLGPLYFDLLWVGTGAIWSDFNGSQTFPDGGDGVVSYVDLGVRGLVRLTDTIYLSLVGNVMYLPQTNEVAFGQGFGLQPLLGFGLDFFYNDTWGEWDVSFSNAFTGNPGFNMNLFHNVSRDGFDSAGRYSFGFRQFGSNNNGSLGNQVPAFFNNNVAFNASRLVWGGAWRLWSSVNHTDFWQDFDFRDHSYRDQISLMLGYEGSIIPFAPRFSYDVSSFDGFQTLYHNASLWLTGRITENISGGGSIGYLTTTGTGTRSVDSILWNINLDHNITARTNHSLSFGEGFFMDDVINQALTSRYLSYRLTHHFARNLSFMLFAQISDQETPIVGRRSGFDASERAGGGATITYRPLDFTSMSASIMHETSLKPAHEYSHWLTVFQLVQQLNMRLTGTIGYQYEESYFQGGGFTEHMIQVGLRRYF